MKILKSIAREIFRVAYSKELVEVARIGRSKEIHHMQRIGVLDTLEMLHLLVGQEA